MPTLPKIFHRQLGYLALTDKIRRFPFPPQEGFRYFAEKNYRNKLSMRGVISK
jgi:hypothetical protein